MSDDESDGDISTCSFCGDKASSNPNLKLLITPCGHTLCNPCCGSSFRASKNVDCKGCTASKVPVVTFRRDELVPTDGEDPHVRKEMKVRHEVLRIYNRQESDFPNRTDYVAYLDKVENIIQNLVNRVDEQQMRDEMEAYQTSSKDIIFRNQQKKKDRDHNFGKRPLSWQIAPAPSLWRKSPELAPAEAPAAPALAAPAPAQSMMPQQAPRAPPPPAHKVEPLVTKVSEGEAKKDPALAKRAAGFSDVYRASRDSSAALLGLRAALRPRLA